MADQQLTIGVDGSQANKETQKLEKNFQKLFGTIESTMRRVDRMNKKFQSMMPPTAVANLQKVNKSLQTAHARATAATKAFEKVPKKNNEKNRKTTMKTFLGVR